MPKNKGKCIIQKTLSKNRAVTLSCTLMTQKLYVFDNNIRPENISVTTCYLSGYSIAGFSDVQRTISTKSFK